MSGESRSNPSSISPSLLERVDKACDNFEQAWRAGQRPRIEDYLADAPEPERPALLRALLALEIELRSEGGEKPTPEEYEQRFPDLVELIKAVFAEALSLDDSERCPGNGPSTIDENRPLPSGPPPALPDCIGRYKICGELGHGKFGDVYLAHDDLMDRKVAIKVPRLASQSAKEQFLSEARSVAQLKHEGIVTAHDFGQEADGRCYIVYEFIEGTNLAERIKPERIAIDPLLPEQAAIITAQVAEALHYAHLQGLVHRDIKPANILLDQQGKPRVTDFGLAVKEEDLPKQRGLLAGTLLYMSPEQVRREGHHIDGRTDIYSLGVVLYELLCGRRPFEAHMEDELVDQILHRDAKPPRQIKDSIPAELERICLKALSRRVSDRYTTAKDMGEELWAAISALKVAPTAAPAPGRAGEVAPMFRREATHEKPNFSKYRHIRIDERGEETVIVALKPLLVSDPLVSEVEEELQDFLQNSRSLHVVLDLSQVERVGSTFLLPLLTLRRRLRDRGAQLKICGVSESVAEILFTLRIPDILGVSRPTAPDTKGLTRVEDSTGEVPHPAGLRENVQFSVYRPKTVRPQEWHSMLAFAHLSERPPGAAENEPDPIAEVQKQARQVLGGRLGDYKEITEDTRHPVPGQGELTFVPDVPGIEFNPPSRSFVWEDSVHREEFRLRASGDLDGQTAKGRMTVFLGSIILAEVPLSMRVDSSHKPEAKTEAHEIERARPYRKIFASYSRKDSWIVGQFKRYAQALGDEYVRKHTRLRAGEQWSGRLQRLIEEADIFQLFWSSNSMHSPFVRREWECALGLRRPNFIRPCYWEEPLPTCPEKNLPPQELSRLHFQHIVAVASEPRKVIQQRLEDVSKDESFTEHALRLGPPLESVDKICHQFEVSWRAGQQARIKDYLADAREDEREELRRRLLALEIELRSARGEVSKDESFGEDAFKTLQPKGRLKEVQAVLARAREQGRSPDQLTNEEKEQIRQLIAEEELEAGQSKMAQRSEPPASQPTSFGNYVVDRLIGAGGLGRVYLGHHISDPLRPLVIKAVPASEHNKELWLRNYRHIAQLRHPGIMKVAEAGIEGDQIYVVTEHVEGTSLQTWLREHRPTWKQTASIVAAIADALNFAHTNGVVHRDVKPSHILLAKNDSPILIGFGLATGMSGDGITRAGNIVGTPLYMPPEQILGQPVDCRADIYSLGVVLYEMLCGRPPFRGTTIFETLRRVREEETPPLRQEVAEIPRDLETICLKAMAKRVTNRYTTAADFAADLRRWLVGSPPATRSQWHSGLRRVGWQPAIALAVVISAIAALLSLFYFFR